MRRLAMLATTIATAVALAVPVAGEAAVAAPVKGGADHAAKADSGHKPKKGKKSSKGKLKVKKSAKGAQPGLSAITITAVNLKGKGKVKFQINGSTFGKAKVKKGKASVKTPSSLGTGDYKVTAKFNGKKGSTKFRVYNSAVVLSSTSFTISKSAFVNRPVLSGSVTFKDMVANKGYLDIYRNGNRAGGTSSPDYLTFASVQPDGTFDFSTGFASSIASDDTYVAGQTYTLQGFYTETPSFAEYIASNFITVTVIP